MAAVKERKGRGDWRSLLGELGEVVDYRQLSQRLKEERAEAEERQTMAIKGFFIEAEEMTLKSGGKRTLIRIRAPWGRTVLFTSPDTWKQYKDIVEPRKAYRFVVDAVLRENHIRPLYFLERVEELKEGEPLLTAEEAKQLNKWLRHLHEHQMRLWEQRKEKAGEEFRERKPIKLLTVMTLILRAVRKERNGRAYIQGTLLYFNTKGKFQPAVFTCDEDLLPLVTPGRLGFAVLSPRAERNTFVLRGFAPNPKEVRKYAEKMQIPTTLEGAMKVGVGSFRLKIVERLRGREIFRCKVAAGADEGKELLVYAPEWVLQIQRGYSVEGREFIGLLDYIPPRKEGESGLWGAGFGKIL